MILKPRSIPPEHHHHHRDHRRGGDGAPPPRAKHVDLGEILGIGRARKERGGAASTATAAEKMDKFVAVMADLVKVMSQHMIRVRIFIEAGSNKSEMYP